MKTRKPNSLANLVASVLNSSTEEGVSVKETLQSVSDTAKSLNLTITINYRAVYQQLKTLGHKTTKGKFCLQKPEEQNQESAAA